MPAPFELPPLNLNLDMASKALASVDGYHGVTANSAAPFAVGSGSSAIATPPGTLTGNVAGIAGAVTQGLPMLVIAAIGIAALFLLRK
jgi:hypothetical protein